jgi:hypothetical protein
LPDEADQLGLLQHSEEPSSGDPSP